MEIQIRKEKVDFIKIINMAFKKKDWGKSHVLYTLGNMTVRCKMTSFDFEGNIATFRVYVDYVYDNLKKEKYECIWYYISNEKIEDFKRRIQKKVISVLELIEEYHLRGVAEGKYRYDKTELRDITENDIIQIGFGDELGGINNLSNSQIQETAMRELYELAEEEINAEYYKLVDVYIINNKIKIANLYELMKNINEELGV